MIELNTPSPEVSSPVPKGEHSRQLVLYPAPIGDPHADMVCRRTMLLIQPLLMYFLRSGCTFCFPCARDI